MEILVGQVMEVLVVLLDRNTNVWWLFTHFKVRVEIPRDTPEANLTKKTKKE